MAPLCLSKLPFEVLEHVVIFIDNSKDLLALALCGKIYYETIVPDHLYLRYIRCDIFQYALWQMLLDRPRLARSIRVLELLRSASRADLRLLPQTLLEIFSYANIPIPCSAYSSSSTCPWNLEVVLKHMDLDEFTWVVDSVNSTQSFCLLRTLFSSCPNITRLRISLPLKDLPPFSMGALTDQPLALLSSVSISLIPWCGSPPSLPALFVDLVVLHCPNLLKLEFLVEDVGGIHIPLQLFLGHWSRLVSIRLEGTISFESEKKGSERQILSRFLSRHITLQGLYLKITNLNFLDYMTDGSLPHLRALSLSGLRTGGAQASFSGPMRAILPQLRHISWEFHVDDFSFVRQMVCLQSCDAIISTETEANVTYLIRCLPPSLQRLNISSRLHWSLSVEELHNYAEAVACDLVRLCNLTCFGGFPRAMNPSSPKCRHLLSTLANLPQIQYVETVLNYQPTWVSVQKGSKGRLYFGGLAAKRIDVHPQYWETTVISYPENYAHTQYL